MAATATDRDAKLAKQRRELPDDSGVYMFRDRTGKALYVGKARSIRKRVAGHFAGRGSSPEMLRRVESIDFLVTGTEAEALLAEQSFIKRHRPRFNIRLRDDKSYPYIAISLEEDYPRVYFTRERHRRDAPGPWLHVTPQDTSRSRAGNRGTANQPPRACNAPLR